MYLGLSKLDDKCRKYHDLSSVIKYLSIFIKFSIGILYKKLSSKHEFYKKDTLTVIFYLKV